MGEERVYAVYMMTNVQRGVLYVGVTGDLVTRVRQHRDGEIGGFTRDWGCKRLVWFEFHGEVERAIAREKAIKRWLRTWKFQLIEALNPGWEDLWEGLAGAGRYPWENELGQDPEGIGARLWFDEDRPRG